MRVRLVSHQIQPPLSPSSRRKTPAGPEDLFETFQHSCKGRSKPTPMESCLSRPSASRRTLLHGGRGMVTGSDHQSATSGVCGLGRLLGLFGPPFPQR